MALSSYEWRELAVIEAALMTEDPSLELELNRMGPHLAVRPTGKLRLPLVVGIFGLVILALGAFTGATVVLLTGVFLALIGPVVGMVAQQSNRSSVASCAVAGRRAD